MDQQSNQENVQNRSSSSNEPNGYCKMLEKSVEAMKTQYADVKFCFDCDGETFKLPAHKCVLAASSPVFNAMFNGDLKEKGDVEIKDASPAVFEEFLHLFYGKPMKLSMEDVAELLKLVDKYDCEDCLPICIDFLKENLTVDDGIVWGLHLALRFRLEELKVHCLNEIQENFEKVWNMFDVKDDGTVQLLSNPEDRFLSEKDITTVYLRISAMSKNIISKLSAHCHRVFPYILVKEEDKRSRVMITEHEIIRFKLTGADLMLTDLFCSNVFFIEGGTYHYHDSMNFEMCIGKSNSEGLHMVFSQKIQLTGDSENHVKLTDPIRISANCTYLIVMKSTNLAMERDYYTHRAMLPTEPVVLTPTTKISFPYRGAEAKYTRSLISSMYFAPIIKK